MSWLPGWNSISSSGFWHNFYELGGIALFLVVVVFELLAYSYGHRRDHLAEDAARVDADRRDQVEGRLQQQVAEANAVASAATERTAELEKLAAPRQLSPQQRTSLIAALASSNLSTGRVTITSVSDREARDFAEQLHQTFVAAGFSLPQVGMLMTPDRFEGLVLRIHDPKSVPSQAIKIQQALISTGLSVPSRTGIELAPGDVNLLVGFKPRQ